ncbi:hypothetical protein [Acuticoccus sediminis]|nr:hypothetical protein [Acuticoccus sediminis]
MLRQNPPFFESDDDPSEAPDVAYDHLSMTAEIDSELQAAIEYKIATSGVGGVETVLRLLNEALRRHT